jgi:nucleoside-triphosphatase
MFLIKADSTEIPVVYIISGFPQSGKTTFAIQLIEKLKASGFIIAGFVAPGSLKDGRRTSFTIVDLKSGQSRPLCSIRFTDGEKIGPFTFSRDGQNFGLKLIVTKNLTETDFVVIDEIGPLELRGGGWAGGIAKVLKNRSINHIWVVRQSLLEKVLIHFEIEKAVVFSIGKLTPEEAFAVISGG